jgi:hypothetical protein
VTPRVEFRCAGSGGCGALLVRIEAREHWPIVTIFRGDTRPREPTPAYLVLPDGAVTESGSATARRQRKTLTSLEDPRLDPHVASGCAKHGLVPVDGKAMRAAWREAEADDRVVVVLAPPLRRRST